MKTLADLYAKAEHEGGLPELLLGYGLNPDNLTGELEIYAEHIRNVQIAYRDLIDLLEYNGYGEVE